MIQNTGKKMQFKYPDGTQKKHLRKSQDFFSIKKIFFKFKL